MTDKREPYVGPRPYKKDERKLFFGREYEADELVSLITAHPVVLLYAQSGAGKSSLLNARVIPKLESDDEGFEVLGPLRVQGQIPANFVVHKQTNIYVLNALLSYDQNQDPKRLSGLTFADFLAQRPPRLNEFKEPSPRVIIIDQFEELFTAYPDRWEERAAFFEQIRDAIEGKSTDDVSVPLRVVFAMREDYIAELDPYAAILPEKLRSRYRLEQLRPHAALSAITKPLEGSGRYYAAGVAEQIVDNLRKLPGNSADSPKLGPYVEPVQLQVVCQTIWQALGPAETEITHKHLKDYGDVNRALSAFYERSIKTVSEKTSVPETDLRSWFGNTLITPEGMRAPVYRGEEKTEGLPNSAVEMLDSMQLIKSELKGANARWYELAHDRFVEPVRTSNDRWLAGQSLDAQAQVRLEQKASKWRHGDGALLNAVELTEAKRLLKSHQSQNEALRALVDASQVSAQHRRLKWMTVGVVVLLVVLGAMGGLAVFAFAQQQASARATSEAERQMAEVERQRSQRAEEARHAALRQQELTERSLKTLELEKKKTEQQRKAAEDALVVANAERQQAMKQRQIAEAQLKVIQKQQELITEDSWLDTNKPVEITPETAPAFDKIKSDVAYATNFLNSYFQMTLDAPAVKPLSEKERNAFWYGRAVHVPPTVQYLPDVAYHETSHLFIDKVIGDVPQTGDGIAIQESYADIYASLIKQHKLGQTAQEADWVIGPGAVAWLKGQNIPASGDKRPLHSLKMPGSAYDDPIIGKDRQIAHVRDLKGGNNLGDAWTHAGIPSKAFYETAIKIGSERAGIIWTQALREPDFPKNLTILRLAQITYRVALKLHGNNSAESVAVKDAWNVVGIDVAR